MSQLSTFESLPQSSATQPLNPALQAALSSLDVNLEQELAEYRRHRPRQKVPSTKGRERPKAEKTLDLISVKAIGGRTQPQAAHLVTAQSLPASIPAMVQPQVAEMPAANAYIASPNAIPATGNDNNEPLRPNPPQTEAPVGTGFAKPAATPVEPDDYLESSEALLKNLEEEETKSSSTDVLLTPLGIGSMLLLLLASAIWGYVTINPSSISHLPLQGLFKRSSPTAQSPANNQPTPRNSTAAGDIPNSPNLASQEFEELSLRSLSSLKPRITATNSSSATSRSQVPVNSPAPLPPAAPDVPIDLSRALLPQPFQPGTLPPEIPVPPTLVPNTASQPTSVANPSSGNTTAQSASATKNEFLVVAPYNRNLTQVRQTVPTAFLRRLPAGTRIQLAAFSNESQAKQKVQELKKKGISAQVVRP